MSGARVGVQDWKWTRTRELAARMVADEDLRDVEIASQCGISDRHLRRLKATPAFQERVQEHILEFRRRLLSRRYCRKEQRILARERIIENCLQIMKERGARPEMQGVPGGRTGLVVLQARSVGRKAVVEFATDKATESIIRANLREIAQEMGDGQVQSKDLVGRVDDQGNPRDRPVVYQITPTQLAVAGDPIIDMKPEVVAPENNPLKGDAGTENG